VCASDLAGIGVLGARIDVDGAIQVQFINTTGSYINTTNNEYYTFVILKG